MNAAGVICFRPYHKIFVAMQMIACGIPADYTDEYLHIGEDTTLACVCMFAKVIIRVFGPVYL
jgi:hypothetical protein